MKINKAILITFIFLFFLSLNMVSAEDPGNGSAPSTKDIYVSTTGNDSSNTGANETSPYATIAKGVSDANASTNATIHLGEGTFTGAGNTEVEINKAHTSQGGSLTIIGAGYNKTFIDGDSVAYIFNIKADSIVNLINLTIINGKSTNGGAITNAGILNITDCIFENNYATSDGGVITSSAGNITISNSIFNNNSAKRYGGVIYSGSTLWNINNSNFTNNYATESGGVLYINGISSSLSNVTNSRFENNYAKGGWANGGSIYIGYGSLINNTIINSTLTGSNSQGGAVYLAWGDNFLANNTMINCSAAQASYIYVSGYVNAYITFANLITDKATTTVTATITDDMGNPIYGNQIYFYANETQLGNANIINGTATLKFTKLLDNGLYNLTGTSSIFGNNQPNIQNGTLEVDIDRNPITFYVSPTGNDETGDGSQLNPYLTLYKAINEGFIRSIYPTIYLMDGTYSGLGNTNMTISDLGILSIIGENYNGAIIDGNLTNWIFKFGEYTQTNLANLTIKNAKSDDYSYSPVLRTTGSVNIWDCIFENNYSTTSIPIVYVDSSAEVNNTVKNLIFRNNIVTGSYYASFYIRNGTIDSSSFINNTNIGSSSGAKNGAAVSSQSITITNSQFINNSNPGTPGTSTIVGGAVKVNGNLVSINNTYRDNYAAGYGGAVMAQSLTSINDTFIGNNASYGGAFYSNGNITGSIFANNSATTYGGAIYANSNINLHNCSFTNNTAGTNGNDLYLSSLTYSVGKIGSGNLTFESLNSTVISNILKAYLTDSEGNIISGGNVAFYVGGKYIGVAEVINGLAQINCIGLENGIYDITGNYTQADNLTVQGAFLNISAEILDKMDIYISPTGSDDTGNGTESNPYATINKALNVGLEKTQNLFIHLLAGTYKGTGIFNVTLPNAVNLTITGTATNQTFLDGENVNWLFQIIQGYGVTKLNNLTIINALASTTVGPTGGYGIIQNYGNLLIENCVFLNNIRTSIVNERSGNLTIKNTYFYNNTGAYNAGAVANFGNAVIDNCLFVANSCTNYGSAIFNAYYLQNNATLLVMDTIIRDTITTHSRGGAVYLGSNSTFKNCYFTNNTMYDIYTSVSAGEPYVTLINTTVYNSTGFGAYGGAHWSVYNSSFVNLSRAITFGSSYSMVIDGCLFNNPLGLIISGSSNAAYNFTMSNSAVLNSLTLYSGLYYLDNNWWGNNSKPTILLSGSNVPTFVLDKWIIMSLSSDNAPGLSQIINLAIKSTDGNNTFDYDVSKIPIPSEDKEFVFNVSNGTITPESGNATAQGMNATYTHNQYGNQTVNAVFNRSIVSLDIELYQLNTTTSISLSNFTGRQGNALVLTADVVDSNSGSPVNVGEVEFFVENRSIGKATVQNGKATLNWIVDEDKGDYEINVRYDGTESYVASENNTMFSVTSINTTTNLNIANSTPKYGDRVNLTSNVTETASGNPVSGGIVKFLADNVLIGTANVVNGLASLNWVVDLDEGQHNITSEYQGIGDYLNSNNQGSLEEVLYTGTDWFIYNYMTNTQIQHIMDNCVSGSNIIFTDGTYSKLFLTASKPMNIKNSGVVNIVGGGTGTAFTINSNNVSLCGLNIKNYTNGVLNKANTVEIASNTFTGNVNGLVNYGSNVDLLYNTISGGQYGIVNKGKTADINYNKISSTSKAGVYNTGSSTRIGHNTLANNYCGVDNRGSSLQISYNTVNGGTTGLMNKASSTLIYSNSIKSVKSYGVYNYGSSNKIYKNTISGAKKGYGIYSKGSKYTLIQSNTVYNFSYGVFSADYKDTIKSNVLRYNTVGLYFYKTAKYASVSYNKIYKNTKYGVYNKGSKTVLYKNQVTFNKKIGLATVKSVKNKKNTIRKNKINIRYIK